MKDEEEKPSEIKGLAVTEEQKDGILSRRALRKKKSENEQDVPKKEIWVQMRMIPIIVRVILVLLLLVIIAIIGLRIGYGYMGDGDPGDVLKKETWMHIVDIIKGKE